MEDCIVFFESNVKVCVDFQAINRVDENVVRMVEIVNGIQHKKGLCVCGEEEELWETRREKRKDIWSLQERE